MRYNVVFSERAKKQLKKLDRSTASLILGWIEKNLQNCENPRLYGKALVENKACKWRYRIGNYRIICEIREAEIVILILEIGHRKEIYR